MDEIEGAQETKPARKKPNRRKLPNQTTAREIAVILERGASGVPARAIARELNRSPQTVCNVLKEFEGVFQELAQVPNYTKVKSDLLSAAELRLLKSMMDETKIEKASLNNAAYAYRQIYDSNRLERGLSTANTATVVRYTTLPDIPDATHTDKPDTDKA